MQVSHDKKVKIQGQLILTENDNTVGKNLINFKKCDEHGKCRLAKGEKIKWEKVKEDVKVNGAKALLGCSCFNCPHSPGVKITFADNKQLSMPKIQKETSLWEDPEAEVQGFMDNMGNLINGAVGLADVPNTIKKLPKAWDVAKNLGGKFLNQAAKEGGDLFKNPFGTLGKYLKQGIMGEASDETTIGGTITEIVIGCIPIVGQIADIRDFGINLFKGDIEGMIMSGIGLIPIIGDLKKLKNIKKADIAKKLGDIKNLAKSGKAAVKELATNKAALRKAILETREALKDTLVRNIAKPMKEAVESMQTFRKRIVSAVDLKKLKASEIICNITKKGCFVAGTLVKTKDGYKRIEEIGANDFVYSWNEKENKMEYKRVLNTSITTAEITRLIELKDGTTVEATLNHPFLEIEKGFLEAKDLEIGSRIFTIEGEMEITSIKEEEYFSKKVYNLYVEDNHNYFISELGLLVHNEEITCLEQAKKVIEQLRKSLEETGGDLSKSSKEVLNEMHRMRKDILDYFKKTGKINNLDKVPKDLDIRKVREFFEKKVNKSKFLNSNGRSKEISISMAKIKDGDKIEYIFSLSGKTLNGNNYKELPAELEKILGIEGKNIRIVTADSGSISHVTDNLNHGEIKLWSDIKDRYKGKKISIEMAIQNTNVDIAGMCPKCTVSVTETMITHPNYDAVIYHGNNK